MSGYVDYDYESGKCAYDAYRQANEDGSPVGHCLPDWDDLPAKSREAWKAAAEAVLKRESERATQF